MDWYTQEQERTDDRFIKLGQAARLTEILSNDPNSDETENDRLVGNEEALEARQRLFDYSAEYLAKEIPNSSVRPENQSSRDLAPAAEFHKTGLDDAFEQSFEIAAKEFETFLPKGQEFADARRSVFEAVRPYAHNLVDLRNNAPDLPNPADAQLPAEEYAELAEAINAKGRNGSTGTRAILNRELGLEPNIVSPEIILPSDKEKADLNLREFDENNVKSITRAVADIYEQIEQGSTQGYNNPNSQPFGSDHADVPENPENTAIERAENRMEMLSKLELEIHSRRTDPSYTKIVKNDQHWVQEIEQYNQQVNEDGEAYRARLAEIQEERGIQDPFSDDAAGEGLDDSRPRQLRRIGEGDDIGSGIPNTVNENMYDERERNRGNIRD